MLIRNTAILMAALWSSGASADWYTQATLGFETREYSLSADMFPSVYSTSLSGPLFGLSLINSENWYLSFETTSGEGTSDTFEDHPWSNYEDVDDDNMTISVGTTTASGLTVFVGFNRNSVDINNSVHTFNPVERLFFETAGFIAGIAKNYPFNDSHSISLSTAFGFMDTDLEIQYYNTLDDGYDRYTGNSSGFSVSASYVYKLSPKVSLSTGVKGQVYSYSNMKDVSDGTDYDDIDGETKLSGFAKASYLF